MYTFKKVMASFLSIKESIYLKSFSCSISSYMSKQRSSSGICNATIDIASSQSSDQPRISDSFKACILSSTFGTRDHWFGFKHWTLSLGGNWGVACFPEFKRTADDKGSVVDVLPSSNWSAAQEKGGEGILTYQNS